MEKLLEKRSRIDSIQVLRAIACLGIMFSHTGYKCLAGAGAWGVAIFFVLSGFMMMYAYCGRNRITSISVKDNLIFAWNKIKSLYLLHIITTLIHAVFIFAGHDKIPFKHAVLKLITNVLLIQEWIPFRDRSINAATWYLSAILFCYFVFPWVLVFFEKKITRKVAAYGIFILFLLQIAFGIIGSQLPPLASDNKGLWTVDTYSWFIYKFPLTRCLDFLLGCNIGYLFLSNDELAEKRFLSIEAVTSVIACLLVVFSNICFLRELYKPVTGQELLGADTGRWWTFVVVFTPSACLLVYTFAHKSARLSKLLTNKVLLYVGNVSQYVFLIHATVFEFLNRIIWKIGGEEFLNRYESLIKLTVGFIISFLLSEAWKRIFDRRKN